MNKIFNILHIIVALALFSQPVATNSNDEQTVTHRQLDLEFRHVCLWACCSSSSWEYDFLMELLPSTKYQHIFMKDFIISGTVHPKLMIYNVENSGHDGNYSVVKDIIHLHRPIILIHTSDEYNGNPKKWKYGEGVEVFNLVPFVLRQYGVFPYRDYKTPRSNVMQLPLGYIVGMLDEEMQNASNIDVTSPSVVKLDSVQATKWSMDKKSDSRNFSWSFVGQIAGRKGRHEMIQVFTDWTPHFSDVGLTPVQIRSIYNNSKFVLVGRGQSSLDCFRLYEAIIAGAIPVIIASQREAELAFEFEGDSPPLLVAHDAQAALRLCRAMSDSQIDAMRTAIGWWYINRMELTKRRINHYVSVF